MTSVRSSWYKSCTARLGTGEALKAPTEGTPLPWNTTSDRCCGRHRIPRGGPR